jgi:hypothetical protein
MNNGIKFFKLKLIKKIIKKTSEHRNILMQELVDNATDPIIVKRRIRMLKHLNSYESQLISKVQNFETDNVDDLTLFNFDPGIFAVVHRSA